MKVIVVGAGITGVATALNLIRRGFKVTLIDRVQPGSPHQTSYGNAGLLARSGIIPMSTPGLLKKIPKMLIDPESPLFVKWSYLPKLIPWLIPFIRSGSSDKIRALVHALDSLTNDTLEEHLRLAKSSGAEGYIHQGNFAYMYRGEKAFESDRIVREIKSDFGYKSKKINRSQIMKLDEHISFRYNVASVFSDHGWITDPGSYLATIFRSYRAEGGEFIKGQVKNILRMKVHIENGEAISASKIVIATGAWSDRFGPDLGFRTKIESERGYHIFFKGANRVPSFPMMVTDGKFIVTPMRGGFRCAGVVEFGGLEAPPSKAPVNLIRKKIKEFYEGLEYEEEILWMGHRPSTPDSLPLIGPVDGNPDIVCAFGGQHVGLTIGPKIGTLVTDLISENRTNFDFSPFKPNRFN